jgi:hypothetical protein
MSEISGHSLHRHAYVYCRIAYIAFAVDYDLE